MDGLNAVLTQLAEQEAKISELETRVRDQADLIAAMQDVGEQVSALSEQLATLLVENKFGDDKEKAYNPFPSIL